jgi:hypothetical protein
MNIKRFIHLLQRAILVNTLLLISACSTVLYQANGEYIDEHNKNRRILVQWEAQKYYIPFVDADVDYGSTSLQVECLSDVFLDSKSDEEQGFIFVERPQDFRLAGDSPEIRIGNFLVCASFVSKLPINELSVADNARLQVLCESKFDIPFLPPSLVGYELSIDQAEIKEETLLCRQ